MTPSATLIIIKDYTVVFKSKVEIPDSINKIAKCINPNCITNNEDIPTLFNVIDKEDLLLYCQYCEKTTKKGNIRFI